MKKLFYLLVLLFLFSSEHALSADCSNGLSVTGKAKKKTAPDIAYVTVYVQANGILMEDARNKADELTAKISEAVKADSNILKNIEIRDVVIGESKTEYWRPDQPKEPARPQVTKRIRFSSLPDPEAIYKIVDKSIRSGAIMKLPSSIRYSDNILSVVAYGLEDSQKIVRELQEKAMLDAKEKADQLAQLADKRVGEIIGIGCSNTNGLMESIRYMGQSPDFPTDYVGLNSKEIEISHTISVTFELID